ncbi:hypothetical protein ABZ609_33815 [Streptomyces rubiginosohelvolus]|uniref:8-oxoguanine DNA glycosylase OGG fold protein n=1 Tax=Streptomyces rubiginosohelvolus TaxID=67362 RepID=UPI0033D9C6A3
MRVCSAGGTVLEQLRGLVRAHAGRVQGPVRFRPGTWHPWLDPHGAGHVLGVGTESVGGPSGDRLITRNDLRAMRDRAGDDPEGHRDLFVAVMIWGSGTTNGRGPRYTNAALSDPRMRPVLRTTRESVRDGHLKVAYRQFTLDGVGRSFFTKWFASVDDRGDDCDRALILDDRVLRSLNALGWSTRQAAGRRDWPSRYAAYVSTMHAWAGEFGVTAEWLEWLLFDLNGRVEIDAS